MSNYAIIKGYISFMVGSHNSLDTMQLFPYEGMEPPEIWLIKLGSMVVH